MLKPYYKLDPESYYEGHETRKEPIKPKNKYLSEKFKRSHDQKSFTHKK